MSKHFALLASFCKIVDRILPREQMNPRFQRCFGWLCIAPWALPKADLMPCRWRIKSSQSGCRRTIISHLSTNVRHAAKKRADPAFQAFVTWIEYSCIFHSHFHAGA